VAQLKAMRAQSVEDLNSRLDAMSQAAESISSLLEGIDGLL
jgi:hypothetical protein